VLSPRSGSTESTSSSCTAQWRPGAYRKEQDRVNICVRRETAGSGGLMEEERMGMKGSTAMVMI